MEEKPKYRALHINEKQLLLCLQANSNTKTDTLYLDYKKGYYSKI